MSVVRGRHRFRVVVEPIVDPAKPETRVRVRLEAKRMDPRWVDLDRDAAVDLVKAVQDALRPR